MTCLVARTGRELQRYDHMGGRQVVRCIPYRYKDCKDGSFGDELEVLVITSQKGFDKGVMFPKGGWELDESLKEAACRESLEEAGVLGNLEDELGQWRFLSKRNGIFYEGYMFPLLVSEQLDLWPTYFCDVLVNCCSVICSVNHHLITAINIPKTLGPGGANLIHEKVGLHARHYLFSELKTTATER